jgi:folate-binding protein YgfZ
METTTELQQLHLYEKHDQAGASWIEFQSWQIPSDYGDVAAELHAMNEHCGLIDKSYFGLIRITGETAQDFLHRMTSNPVNNLQVGEGMETVVPTAEGRFVDWITVYRIDENEMLAVTSAGAEEHIITFLQGYIFFKDDVHFEPVNSEWTLLQLSGPSAEPVVQASFPGNLNFETPYVLRECELHETPLFISRVHGISENDLQILCPASISEAVYEKLMSADKNLRPVGFEAYEIQRITSGLPAYGHEITDEYMLTEAHLETALNLESGCFTGQEVIARTLNYDKVKQHLCHFLIKDNCDISVPADLKQDGRTVGKLTSVVFEPIEERIVALGYVKTKYLKEEATFGIADTDRVTVRLIKKTEPR